MIRVTIDLITKETGSKGRTLYTLEVVNDGTGDRDIGNYDVVVRSPVSSRADGYIGEGRVTDFERSKHNALTLVIRALNALKWSK